MRTIEMERFRFSGRSIRLIYLSRRRMSTVITACRFTSSCIYSCTSFSSLMHPSIQPVTCQCAHIKNTMPSAFTLTLNTKYHPRNLNRAVLSVLCQNTRNNTTRKFARARRFLNGKTNGACLDCPSKSDTSYADSTANPCRFTVPTTRLLDCE